MIRYSPAQLPPFKPAIQLTVPAMGSPGAEHRRLVASASDGIYEILRSAGRAGRVLLPAYTCSRVAHAVLAAGDRPTFVDVDPLSGSFAAGQFEQALRENAKAVILTHLFGWNDQFDAHCRLAKAKGLLVIEDSALLLTARDFQTTTPSARVTSFGRGKPLPLGGGGEVRIYNKSLRNLHDQWTGEPDRRAVFTFRHLMRGALRDSKAALGMANARVRLRAKSRSSKHPTPDSNFISQRLSDRASACLEHQVQRSSIRGLAEVTKAALQRYRDAFSPIESGISQTMGSRLPVGLAAPALAIRCNPRERESLLADLAAQWIDCPRYWQYCVGEDMTGKRFPGARQLADSILFLPLHAGVETSGARKLARTLQSHRLHPFS